MLSALRGILQRWVGMTAEVQALEAEEAPAVPAATPTCSTDYASIAAARRLKRPGTLNNEATDLKRPRTAPATPVDAGPNGANPSVGKGSDPDGNAAEYPHQAHATRPSATASAPAALNRTHRPQSSVSTSLPAVNPGVSGAGPGASAPSASQPCGVISGIVTGPRPLAMQSQQLQQRQQQIQQTVEEGANVNVGSDQLLLAHQKLEQDLSHMEALQAQVPPSLHSSTAGDTNGNTVGGATAAPAGEATLVRSIGGSENSPPRSCSGASTRNQHHAHHTSHLGDHHHRHDALEEQVFSPAFHLPASASPSGSPNSSPQASRTGWIQQVAAASKLPQNSAVAPETSSAVTTVIVALAAARAASVTAAAKVATAVAVADGPPSVEMRSSHHHGSDCMQLHAIDLNVVDGVLVDTDDDELAAAGTAPVSIAAKDAAWATGRHGHLSASSAAVAEGPDLVPGIRNELQRQQVDGGGGGGSGQEIASHRSRATDQGASSSVSDSGAAIEAVGEELSSSSSGEVEADVARGGVVDSGRDGFEEADFFECDENDENAPISQLAGASPHSMTAAVVEVGTTASVVQQRGERDPVLVASAPRSLAAAVSAAVAAAAVVPAAAQPDSQFLLQTQQVDVDEEEEEEDEGLMEFDPLVFIKQLPSLESCVPPHRPVLLPLKTRAMARRKTLVLDLDETLVHSSLEAVERSDFSFPVVFNGTEHQVYVRQRPHLRDFMVRVSALFEVVVFTASQRIYAERLLDILDPLQQLVRHRIYRDSCVVVDGNYLKDLSILGRDLAHTIIVDNSPQAFGFQVDNGIPIESWYDDDNDMELLRLLPFLETLAGADVEDVRPRIRLQFRLRELIARA